MKVALHVERLWDRNITITTCLVDTASTSMTPPARRCCSIFYNRTSSIPSFLITYRFELDHILDAYETFGHAANTSALKVIMQA